MDARVELPERSFPFQVAHQARPRHCPQHEQVSLEVRVHVQVTLHVQVPNEQVPLHVQVPLLERQHMDLLQGWLRSRRQTLGFHP